MIDNLLRIKGGEVHHINVLRYKVKDHVYVNEYEIEITELSDTTLVGNVVGTIESRGEPKVDITLFQAYLKSDKMDYVVQKAVELGVKEITPIITKNVIVKLEDKDKTKKVERLSKIAKEAVEQCGRTDIVRVNSVSRVIDVDFSVFDAILVCHEQSKNNLNDTMNSLKKEGKLKKVAVLIGPEGGFEQSEVDSMLLPKNTYEVSLGQRVLRAETASLCILSILWYELEK